MPRREPLYPHVPKSRKPGLRIPSPNQEIELRFLPDSPEVLTRTVNATGYRAKIASVFREAIARAKGVRR